MTLTELAYINQLKKVSDATKRATTPDRIDTANGVVTMGYEHAGRSPHYEFLNNGFDVKFI
ncbi:MAG: hypothetical protein K0U20_08765 [Proteobacteria bacterium]|nr:hypothetical protein [Pseudomonadota bacterium]